MLKRKNFTYIYFIYILILLLLTIIPQFSIDQSGFHMLTDYESQINLEPFNFIYYLKTTLFVLKNPSYFLINILGNILIFVPIGFGSAYLLKKANFFKVVSLGFLFSCFIEFVQLFLPRATDIDDVMLNVLGVCIGYFIYVLTKKRL